MTLQCRPERAILSGHIDPRPDPAAPDLHPTSHSAPPSDLDRAPIPHPAALICDRPTPDHRTPSPPAREADPEARRLIAHLLHLETHPWPATLPAYADALLTLATRCDARPAKAEALRWLHRDLARALHHRAPALRAARADALHDLVATFPTHLLRLRAALHPHTAPNIRSMLAIAIAWNANDLHKSRVARHHRRETPLTERPAATHLADPYTATLARQLAAHLAAADAPARALLHVARGESIASAARLTGASRQQIYRAREHLRRDR